MFYWHVSHRSDFTCETNKNGTKFSYLNEYFYLFRVKADILRQNEANILKKRVLIETLDL